MENKIKEWKVELLGVIELTPLSEINRVLNGRDGIRGYSLDLDGYYCNNSEYSLDVIDKDGLTLTIQVDVDEESEAEYLFENTPECESGMDFDEWDGTFKVTLNENTGIVLLLELLNYI